MFRAAGMKKTLIAAVLLILAGGEISVNAVDKNLMKATFAGGCFWCMQPAFEHLHGVVSATVGYTGGRTAHPTYEEVCTGTTGHAEAVEVVYDPARISYDALLDAF